MSPRILRPRQPCKVSDEVFFFPLNISLFFVVVVVVVDWTEVSTRTKNYQAVCSSIPSSSFFVVLLLVFLLLFRCVRVLFILFTFVTFCISFNCFFAFCSAASLLR